MLEPARIKLYLNQAKPYIIFALAISCILIIQWSTFEPVVWEKEIIQATVLGSYQHPLTQKRYVRVELDSGKVVSIKGGVPAIQTPNTNGKVPLLVRGRKARLIRGKKDSAKEFYRFVAE